MSYRMTQDLSKKNKNFLAMVNISKERKRKVSFQQLLITT